MSDDFKDFFTYDRAVSNKFNKDQLVKKAKGSPSNWRTETVPSKISEDLKHDSMLDHVVYAMQAPKMRMTSNFSDLFKIHMQDVSSSAEDYNSNGPSGTLLPLWSSAGKKALKKGAAHMSRWARGTNRFNVTPRLAKTAFDLTFSMHGQQRNQSNAFFNARPPFDDMWIEMDVSEMELFSHQNNPLFKNVTHVGAWIDVSAMEMQGGHYARGEDGSHETYVKAGTGFTTLFTPGEIKPNTMVLFFRTADKIAVSRNTLVFSQIQPIWAEDAYEQIEVMEKSRVELDFSAAASFLSQTIGDNELVHAANDAIQIVDAMGQDERQRRRYSANILGDFNMLFWDDAIQEHAGWANRLQTFFENQLFQTFLNVMNLFNFEWVTQERQVVTGVKGRKFRDKKPPKVDSYCVVDVDLPKFKGIKFAQKAVARQERMGMRQHKVVRHKRTYHTKNGPITRWVGPMLRGDPKLGFVDKEYNLNKSSERM
tara:strand:+ start:51 stop:1493 length:1443 start_codon:yes stop_codon:yes gene_type:complete